MDLNGLCPDVLLYEENWSRLKDDKRPLALWVFLGVTGV